MKKSKILAPALAILCLSTAASVTGTVAWFAANNVVTASGMQINVSAPSSIVISKDSLPTASTTGASVSFTVAGSHSLSPCTYSSSLAAPHLGTPVIDGDKIDKTTGLPKVEADYTSLTYSAAGETGSYYHTTIYIATAPFTASITGGKKLAVTLSNGNASTLTNTLLAGSISYFVKYVSTGESAADVLGTYVGTLNLAGMNRALNTATALNPNQLDLYSATESTPIPNADSLTKGVRIDMYAYFDGGLLSVESATYADKRAYVNTDTVNALELALSSQFDLINI